MADASCTLQHIDHRVCLLSGWVLILRGAFSCITGPCSDVLWLASEFWHLKWLAAKAHELCSPAELIQVVYRGCWRGWTVQTQQQCGRCLPGSLGYLEYSLHLSNSCSGCDGKGEEVGISPSQFIWKQILQTSPAPGTVKAWGISVCPCFPRYSQLSQ